MKGTIAKTAGRLCIAAAALVSVSADAQMPNDWQFGLEIYGIGYSFHWGDIVGAWRYLDYDFKSSSPIQDLTFSGPAISAVFRW